MIHEHDRFVLAAPLPDEGLERGDIGAVVHIYPGHEAYEVEFVTLTGQTAAVVTVSAGQVRPGRQHQDSPRARVGASVVSWAADTGLSWLIILLGRIHTTIL